MDDCQKAFQWEKELQEMVLVESVLAPNAKHGYPNNAHLTTMSEQVIQSVWCQV